MKFLFLVLTTIYFLGLPLLNGQEVLKLKFNPVFEHAYKSNGNNDQYAYQVFHRERMDYQLLNTGQIAHLRAEVMGYRKSGQSQADFKGYGSLQLYNINKWQQGVSSFNKTFSYANYGSDHYASASEHALNNRPIDFVETQSFIVVSYNSTKDQQLMIRNKKLEVLFTLKSNDHLNGERFEIKGMAEGVGKSLYIIATLKSDQKLAVIKIHPSGGDKYNVNYKRFNYKPGSRAMKLHHIKDELFYISYVNKGANLVNKFDASDILDDAKEYVDPGNNMKVISNAHCKIAHVNSEGVLIGYYTQSSSNKTVLFYYNPQTKEVLKQESLDYSKYGRYISDVSYYNGELAIASFPYDESGNLRVCEIRIYDQDLKLKAKSNENLVTSNGGAAFKYSIDETQISLTSRKLLLKNKESFKEPNKYLVVEF